jgi:hypothetical protein
LNSKNKLRFNEQSGRNTHNERHGKNAEDIWFGKIRKVSQIINEDISLRYLSIYFCQDLHTIFIVKGSIHSSCKEYGFSSSAMGIYCME